MSMRESDFQTKFLRWVQYQEELHTSVAFELKLTKTKSIPFHAVQPHQSANLRMAKHKRFKYKIPDDSIGQKPFDCFLLEKVPSFVVVMFYKRGEKKFYLIDVDTWLGEEKKSNRKSLTEERASAIGKTCFLDKVNCV